MDAIRIYTTVEQDGEIHLANLSLKRGQRVELIVLPEAATSAERPLLTAAALVTSRVVGLWEGREDSTDSSAFARQLRDQAQHRNRA
jgi:hypothetical protein